MAKKSQEAMKLPVPKKEEESDIHAHTLPRLEERAQEPAFDDDFEESDNEGNVEVI